MDRWKTKKTILSVWIDNPEKKRLTLTEFYSHLISYSRLFQQRFGWWATPSAMDCRFVRQNRSQPCQVHPKSSVCHPSWERENVTVRYSHSPASLATQEPWNKHTKTPQAIFGKKGKPIFSLHLLAIPNEKKLQKTSQAIKWHQIGHIWLPEYTIRKKTSWYTTLKSVKC